MRGINKLLKSSCSLTRMSGHGRILWIMNIGGPMGSLNQSENEVAAKRLFEAITQIELKSNEDGSRRRVDYVSAGLESLFAMEVTTHTNEDRNRLANGGPKFSGVIQRSDLLNDWVIQTRDYPHLKSLRDDVIPQLRVLTLHGITEYHKSQHEWWMSKVSTLKEVLFAFNKASVEYVKRQSVLEKREGDLAEVVVLPMVNWIYGGPDSALEIIETEQLNEPDNLEKLRDSGATNRHLFIWVNQNTDRNVLDAFNAERIGLPTRAPRLPEEITHLWVVNIETEVGWYFEPIEGWRLVGKS